MKTKGKQMTNWTNIKIDLDYAIKTIEEIDCETAKLEDNEDKLNYLYLRLHTIEKSLQKDLQKIFETTLPRNYYLTRKKIKVSITHRNHTILVTIPRGKKIEFFSKEREFKRLLFKFPLNMYANTTEKEANIFIIC